MPEVFDTSKFKEFINEDGIGCSYDQSVYYFDSKDLKELIEYVEALEDEYSRA